jgi:hypothetical protein
MPPTAPKKGVELTDGMAKLMGLTAVMRGAATMVMFAAPIGLEVAYPWKVKEREQEVHGSACRGTAADIMVLFKTMQLESGSKVVAF